MTALFRTFYAVEFIENALTIHAILFKIYKDFRRNRRRISYEVFPLFI